MGYGQYLKELLRPLELYELDEGPGAQELEVEGAQLDRVYDRLLEIERESIPVTACDWGLRKYEEILPYYPAASTVEARRAAVTALLRIDGSCFTPAALQDTIAGCGISVDLQEYKAGQTVIVSFPGVRGEPERFEALQERIEQILPCHLIVQYKLDYLTWVEARQWKLTWEKINGLSWDALQRYEEV